MTSEQKARMLRGEPYIFDDEITADYRKCKLVLEQYNRTSITEPEIRRDILENLLAKIGDDTMITPPFTCDLGYFISVGSGCVFNYGVTILDCGPVTIGDHVALGNNVQLLSAEHPLLSKNRLKRWTMGRPVVIEDRVWLAAGVIVYPGVTIGQDTIVAAGSVVTRNLPAGVLAAGNPARVVRKLTEDDDKLRWPGIDDDD
jgi:maltose O-acetyltransferase